MFDLRIFIKHLESANLYSRADINSIMQSYAPGEAEEIIEGINPSDAEQALNTISELYTAALLDDAEEIPEDAEEGEAITDDEAATLLAHYLNPERLI